MGIWFKSNLHLCPDQNKTSDSFVSSLRTACRNIIPHENSIVRAVDGELVTDFVFMLMCQMSPNNTNKNDDESNCHLVCIHCMGESGSDTFIRNKHSKMCKKDFFVSLYKHID